MAFRPDEQLSDEDLILQVQEGRRQAFDLLVLRYKDRLYNFILKMVRDPELAEEIAQDTFVRAYIHADKYRTIARFSTWLYTIARNLIVDSSRRQRHRNHDSLDRSPGGDGPALVERGPLTISIATEGLAPALSRKIRMDLERYFGPEYIRYTRLIGEARSAIVNNTQLTGKQKKKALQSLLSLPIRERLAGGAKISRRDVLKKLGVT